MNLNLILEVFIYNLKMTSNFENLIKWNVWFEVDDFRFFLIYHRIKFKTVILYIAQKGLGKKW